MTNDPQADLWRGAVGRKFHGKSKPSFLDPGNRPWGPLVEGVSPTSIVEPGCGRGPNLLALAKLFPEARVVGVDVNAEAVHYVNEKCVPNIEARIGTVCNLLFQDREFDLVVTAGTLIHVSNENLPAALSEISRVCRKWIVCCEYHREKERTIKHGSVATRWDRNWPVCFAGCLSAFRLVGRGAWKPGYFEAGGSAEIKKMAQWFRLERK